MSELSLADRLIDNGILRPIDVEAGMFLSRLTGQEENSPVFLTGALTSAAIAHGHVCLPLSQLEQQLQEAGCKTGHGECGKLRDLLLETEIAGPPGTAAPLVIDSRDNLYFNRYHHYEQLIASGLRTRMEAVSELKTEAARSVLKQLFTPEKTEETGPDYQMAAAALSLFKRIMVVSGGPGTGKTYTVARMLAAHQALAPTPLRIGLAAPTGKAAARLRQSLRHAKRELPQDLAAKIPDGATTLHRLLRYQPSAGRFAHNRENPLPLDLLVVDEASMIDMVMMATLMAALPENCRLVLFGDKHQLASVEAGSLFADICGMGPPVWSPDIRHRLSDLTGDSYPEGSNSHLLDNCIVVLEKSYRFDRKSGIGVLAAAVNSGERPALERCLATPFTDLAFSPPADHLSGGPDLASWTADRLVPIFSAQSPGEALAIVEASRILCALHQGKGGVSGVNSQIETLLRSGGHIRTDTEMYRGRPIMIRRNDYTLELYNGDTGILWPDSGGTLQAWFSLADGSLRPLSPQRLPEHQTAYAITVHKSQGSEFDHVLLALPAADSPVVTRELIYTGITRAKKWLNICAGLSDITTAAGKTIRRFSGLGQKLRPEGGGDQKV